MDVDFETGLCNGDPLGKGSALGRKLWKMFIILQYNKHIIIIFIKYLLLKDIISLGFAVGRAHNFIQKLATE